jgi:hypothetical protein
MFLKSSLQVALRYESKRTTREQTHGPAPTEPETTDMLKQILTTLHTSRETLVQDMLGAGALVVMLLGALHWPGMM